MGDDIAKLIKDLENNKVILYKNGQFHKELPKMYKTFAELKSSLREEFKIDFQNIRASYEGENTSKLLINTEQDFFESLKNTDAYAFYLYVDIDESKIINTIIPEIPKIIVPPSKPWKCDRCRSSVPANLIKCRVCGLQKRN
ncbi:hypothetical protein SteCoe_25029 [Stentor coeruleus]|uniref:Uncharacterized protein n=1 Tax=Stentor coeruleus TaxID=5963 RepID=A0A1R2BG70_9CILI|nr:hypothetical protein SteCoe_25029 [Stentor coeruleus]